jgi:hypothetical protein
MLRRLLKFCYYSVLGISFVASAYFIVILLAARPARAEQVIDFDYGIYRQPSDSGEVFELLIGGAGHLSKTDPNEVSALIAPVKHFSQPYKIVFLIDGDAECYRFPEYRKIKPVAVVDVKETIVRYVESMRPAGNIDCLYPNLNVDEDYFRRSFRVFWATFDRDDLYSTNNTIGGLPVSDYHTPGAVYVSTGYEPNEDYHVSGGVQQVLDNEDVTLLSFPDDVQVSWNDTARERTRDIALLLVGTFLGMLTSVFLEITKRYA